MTEKYYILCDEFDERWNKLFDNKADALAYRRSMAEKFLDEIKNREPDWTLKDCINLIYIKKYTCGTMAELVAVKPHAMIYISDCENYSVTRQWWSRGKYISPNKRDLDDVADRW